ncbi:MAG: hypothetical protein E4H00_06715 [Myxococcales bacterium]|nr:MAG: hypothetical protein E4H00_06715 [Myxococcales bacterium]
MRKSVQLRASVQRRCPGLGVLCFLCAFISSVFGAQSASADGPLPAINTTSLAAPATILGVNNVYLLAAAMEKPQLRPFTFLSRDLLRMYQRVERLAIYGVTLNQRKVPRDEKLNLRVQSTYGGGFLQLRYRR